MSGGKRATSSRPGETGWWVSLMSAAAVGVLVGLVARWLLAAHGWPTPYPVVAGLVAGWFWLRLALFDRLRERLAGLEALRPASLVHAVLRAVRIRRAAEASQRGAGGADGVGPAVLAAASELAALAWLAAVALSGPFQAIPPALGVPVLYVWAATVAIWEGDEDLVPTTKARLWLCLAAVLFNLSAVHGAVCAAHDWVISDRAVLGLPHLWFWIPLGAWLCLLLVLFCLLSIDPFWYAGRNPGKTHQAMAFMNRLAFWFLKRGARCDSCGGLYPRLRHWGHRLAADGTWSRRLWAGVRACWLLLLGTPPAWLVERLIGPSFVDRQARYEQFVRSRLRESEAETDRRLTAWEQAQWLPPSAGSAGGELGALARAVDRGAQAWLALSDYLLCRYVPCYPYVRADTLWELAGHAESLFWALPLGRDPAGALRRRNVGEPVAAGLAARLGPLRQRLGRCYAMLQAGASEGVAGLLDFRRRALAAEEGRELGHGERYHWRQRLLAWLRTRPSDAPCEILVDHLLLELRLAGDADATIEVGRQIRVDTDYALTRRQHRALGTACLETARRLGDGFLGRWAYGQAQDHLFAAEAREVLAQMSPSGKEIPAHVCQVHV